jgi:hypothetical protein
LKINKLVTIQKYKAISGNIFSISSCMRKLREETVNTEKEVGLATQRSLSCDFETILK